MTLNQIVFKPLISIIIPVYNVASYLCECLDSVVNQTYKNLEIIIVDDGSTDDSGQICDAYKKKDQRIRVIHQVNGGLSAARNAGLDIMSGDIVAFLDSDDALKLDFFQIMVQAMIKDGVDIVVCEYYTCYTTKRMSGNCKKDIYRLENGIYTSSEALQRIADHKINHSVWNKIYKSDLFNDLRFPVGINYEDAILIPVVFEKSNSIMTIKRPLLYYRKRPLSITTTPTKKNISDFLYSRVVRADFISKHIPGVFTTNQIIRFKDECLMSYISMYLDVLFNRDSKKVKLLLNHEINKGGTYIKRCTLKTKVLYYSFKINPIVCFSILKCYWPIGALIRTIKKHNVHDGIGDRHE
ncbi:glycosyltransferase [uncultured Ruminococcus sp.]|uniref:glycosyltransferase family 2 protein n=1 Tax=uncultured Ruminococcus sp. TaxID=165186 RepID=UPI00261FFFBC|nr:glycosyltransferase [uncultured Ruminococcus sp.]